MGAARPGDTGSLETQISSQGEYDEFLRAVAHAPSRRPPPDVPLGGHWGMNDRYVLERRLGRGGMGIVYAATDTLLGRLVALKVLDLEGAAEIGTTALLLREARLAASVEHERIARVYDVGEHDGCPFVAMEYLSGVTLRSWMLCRTVSPAEAIAIGVQIAEGLAALHECQVIHRDLKPENVMLTDKGAIKLLDFGLARRTPTADGAASGRSARAAEPASRSASIVSGTPGYMAPEQRRGERSDARSDVFALGVVLYELVAGERPFLTSARDFPPSEASASPPPSFTGEAWQSAPAELRAIILRAVATSPTDRFADGAAFLAALREISSGLAIVPPAEVRAAIEAATTMAAPYSPCSPGERRAPPRPRRWRLALGAGALLAGGGAVATQIATPAVARPPPLPPAPPGMTWVDEGTIRIGRSAAQIGEECASIGPSCDRAQMMREVPGAEVTIAPFLLDVHEITNDDMARMLNRFTSMLYVVADEDDHFPRYVRWSTGLGPPDVLVDLDPYAGGLEYTPAREFGVKPGFERLPVVQTSWFGARWYCSSLGKRLPTENEWEAAARGHEDRRFPWGNDAPRCADVVIPRDGLIPLDPACPPKRAPAPIESAAQDVTPRKIYDLAGNVAEWTASTFVEGSRTSPSDERVELPKVIRGGSWAASLPARTTGRTSRPPGFVGSNLGFRCAADRTIR
jgi:formylglycine-generating enzyme required for sulfatase activity